MDGKIEVGLLRNLGNFCVKIFTSGDFDSLSILDTFSNAACWNGWYLFLEVTLLIITRLITTRTRKVLLDQLTTWRTTQCAKHQLTTPML